MIIHTKNEHINVNNKLENDIRKDKKYRLRRFAAALAVSGSIFLIASTGNIFGSKPLDDPITIEEELSGLDIDNEVRNEYNSSYRFLYHFGKSDDKNVKTTASIEYVDAGREMSKELKDMVKGDILAAAGVEGNIYFRQNNADGEFYITGDLALDQSKIPSEILNFMQETIIIESYQGDGSSTAWDKATDNFSNHINKAIKLANQIHGTNYVFKDGKIVQEQKTH